MAELLTDPDPGAAADAIVPSAWSNRVHLLPASSRLAVHDGVSPTLAELQRLATVLDGVAERYHAILIDCGPHLGALTMSALTAADGALVVVDPSEFGLRGIAPAVTLVNTMAAQTNPRLEMGGIVVNKMTAHHVENERQYSRADELAGWVPVWRPAIPERIVVYRAAAERRPVHAFGPKATDVTDAFDHLWLRTGASCAATCRCRGSTTSACSSPPAPRARRPALTGAAGREFWAWIVRTPEFWTDHAQFASAARIRDRGASSRRGHRRPAPPPPPRGGGCRHPRWPLASRGPAGRRSPRRSTRSARVARAQCRCADHAPAG